MLSFHAFLHFNGNSNSGNEFFIFFFWQIKFPFWDIDVLLAYTSTDL